MVSIINYQLISKFLKSVRNPIRGEKFIETEGLIHLDIYYMLHPWICYTMNLGKQ